MSQVCAMLCSNLSDHKHTCASRNMHSTLNIATIRVQGFCTYPARQAMRRRSARHICHVCCHHTARAVRNTGQLAEVMPVSGAVSDGQRERDSPRRLVKHCSIVWLRRYPLITEATDPSHKMRSSALHMTQLDAAPPERGTVCSHSSDCIY